MVKPYGGQSVLMVVHAALAQFPGEAILRILDHEVQIEEVGHAEDAGRPLLVRGPVSEIVRPAIVAMKSDQPREMDDLLLTEDRRRQVLLDRTDTCTARGSNEESRNQCRDEEDNPRASLKYEDQHVAIIGGANSAGQGAVHFSAFADSVTMLVRGPTLERSMSRYLIEQVEALANVTVRTETVATAAEGEDGRLRRLRVRGPDGKESVLHTDACFVFIGASPRTDWLEGVVARDGRGFILAGPDVQTNGWPLGRDPYPLETSVPGVFAAGDVRARSIKRVASAVGEGSMAVSLVHQYLVDA